MSFRPYLEAKDIGHCIKGWSWLPNGLSFLMAATFRAAVTLGGRREKP